MSEFKVKYSLTPILNSSLTYCVRIRDNFFCPVILFNKKNGHVHANVIQHESIDKDTHFKITSDLAHDKFAKVFLNLENLKSQTHEYIYKFNGINRMFEKDIYIDTRQCLNLRTGRSSDKKTNYLICLIFRFVDDPNNFAYMFLQRRCFNLVTRINTVTSQSIQFSNEQGEKILQKFVDLKERKRDMIKKVRKIPSFLLNDE